MLVDAEHTYFQPAIDALAIRLQQRCNRQEPVVLNTYQVTYTTACSLIAGMPISVVQSHSIPSCGAGAALFHLVKELVGMRNCLSDALSESFLQALA